MAAPGLTQAQARAADIAFHTAALTSAIANSISPSASLDALRSLGAPAPNCRPSHRIWTLLNCRICYRRRPSLSWLRMSRSRRRSR